MGIITFTDSVGRVYTCIARSRGVGCISTRGRGTAWSGTVGRGGVVEEGVGSRRK